MEQISICLVPINMSTTKFLLPLFDLGFQDWGLLSAELSLDLDIYISRNFDWTKGHAIDRTNAYCLDHDRVRAGFQISCEAIFEL